jgi:uncharacterized protein (DUF2267 family)
MDDERFLASVQRYLGVDRGEAERATQAVLSTLAERISKEEALQLATELPPAVAPYAWTNTPAERMDVETFVAKVAGHEGVDQHTAARHVRAVLAAVARAVSPKQWADVTGMLSKDFTPLLPTGPDVRLVPADAFLRRVAERAERDEQGARQATAAVFETLAERVAAGEVEDLAEHLPTELKQLLKDAEHHTPPTARRMSLEQFVEQVAQREHSSPARARQDARAVLVTLHEAVGDDEFFDLTSQLPQEYDQLWLAA